MGESETAFEVLPTAIRVFYGFRNPELTEERFRESLGKTFMPGTPYMLQSLGLNAYLPAAIPEQAAVPSPHEVALIAYVSPQEYQRITFETLRGRVYSATHGGVYARGRSRAAFPILLAADGDQPAFHFFDRRTDWQHGLVNIFVGVKANPATASAEFRKSVRRRLFDLRDTVAAAGTDQCIGTMAEDFVVLWTHRSDGVATPFDCSVLAPDVTKVQQMEMLRIICRAEPPVVEIAATAVAFNFIFLRYAEWYLR